KEMTKKFVSGADEFLDITPYDHSKDKQFVMSLIEENPRFLSYEFVGKPPGTTEKCLTEKNHYTFVLCKNNHPVGFVNFFIKDKTGSIDLIGVDKNHQKKGYGLLLVKYALKKLKELNVFEASLTVNKENEKAQRLYEKIGFIADSKSDSLRVWRYTKKL
ncbi:MAG: GNAT family N-acetyltransferase, partial [Chlamydiota bacterium]